MPVLRNILIDERDQYLTEKIRSAPGKRIVAVVVPGMCGHPIPFGTGSSICRNWKDCLTSEKGLAS